MTILRKMVHPKQSERKKELTGNEILAKYKKNENDFSKAVMKMILELCPFDINDEEALSIEERLLLFRQ